MGLRISMAKLQQQSVKPEKLSVFIFDQPDKYIQIARAKLSSGSPVGTAERRSSKKTGQRRSVFRWLHRQWTIAPEFVQLSCADSILSQDQHDVLYSFLPPRYQTGNSELAFCSGEHGISILTLLSIVEQFPATLLVVRTTKQETFGAFCSGHWNTRHASNRDLNFFGLGETFLFTFDPENRIYPWVGWTSTDRSNLPISHSLFLAANSSTIVVGGGGDSGIRFASDLSKGYTGPCMTFDNQPLCKSRDFTVTRLEVYGLTT